MMLTLRALLTRVTLPLLAVLAFTTSSQLHAQFFMDGGGEEVKKQLLATIELQKKSAENRIRSRIADMDRACQLSDSQKQKLSIASKGAVKAHLNEVKKELIDYAKEMGVEIDPDAEPEEKDEDEANDANAQMQAAMAQEIFLSSMFGRSDAKAVEDGKVWQSAVKKVLDDDQSTKWKQWQDQRNAYQRKVAVDHFIAKVDRKLLLSPEQREQLSKYVDEKHGKELCEQAIANDGNQFGMVFFGGDMMAGGDEADSDEPLKTILSESQLSEWQKDFAPQLSGMGGGGAIGGWNIMPPVPQLIEEDVEDQEEEDDN